jgi:lycopene beta-cyclase
VGGGLANGLIAYRLQALRPEVHVTVIERGDRLGGHHVWCFHDGDLTATQHEWMAPLVMQSWQSHEVNFPARRRRIDTGYHAVTSDHFHEVIARVLGDRARLDTEVDAVMPGGVRLRDGQMLEADAVVDGRGHAEGDALALGHQKFLGQWLELENQHDLDGPILMDATVDQLDGFRFMYTLPFGDHLVHVEDTRYSDTDALDRDALRAGIRAYAEQRGWRVRRVHREEEGALPIVLGGDIDAFWSGRTPGVACSGMRGALFHPTTGYSLPEAVRLAEAIADSPQLDAVSLHELTQRRSRRLWRSTGYFRLLNRMLFRAAEPARRYVVMQQFYGRSADLIGRFYAGRLTTMDRLQILSGRPPVPLGRAMKCLFDDGAHAA